MIRPIKRLGQNFLQDPNVARKIVDALEAPAGATVVEIGPGTGALTELLAERYVDLTAFEVDERSVAHLRQAMPALDVRHGDVLDVDLSAVARDRGAPLYVIGNLPYNITSPILFHLLDHRDVLRRAVLMMQLEVAERLVAVPRTKAYGILSVQLQLLARPSLLFKVSRNVFYPRPAVTSAVVGLSFEDPAPDVDVAFLRTVVRTAFSQRRKTLRNSLSRWTREQGIVLPNEWDGHRAEALPPEAYVALARYLWERQA